MNTNHTLKHLADLGAEAALEIQERLETCMLNLSPAGSTAIYYEQDRPAREAFVKAVLDAIGYQFPVDPEREAYEKWFSSHPSPEPYDAWLAGREELLKSLEVRDARSEQELAEELSAEDPPWIEWKGGPCPIPDTVKRWEYKLGDGRGRPAYSIPSAYKDNWEHAEDCDKMYHITAYRVLDWGSTPETFEAHGHTWFKHTPCEGRPESLPEDKEINWLLDRELTGSYMEDTIQAGRLMWRTTSVVGWRYAE